MSERNKMFSGNRKPHSGALDNPSANRELIMMRLNAGYTQAEAAELLNISRPLYSMIELNKRNGKYIIDDAKKLFAQ